MCHDDGEPDGVSMRYRVARRQSAAPPARRRPPGRKRLVEEPLPPLQRTVLSLQQTAGNAAVSTLLRQPTSTPAPSSTRTWLDDFLDPFAEFWEEWQVRADVEADRMRIEAHKKQHEQRVREYEQRPISQVLKSKGVGTTTRVNEGTAALLQAALSESKVLRPYIQSKFPKSNIPDKVKIHGSDAEFEYSYTNQHDLKDSPAALKAQAEKVRGFFHRKTGTIHLRPTSNLGHALHEAVHKLASPAFLNFYGSFWEEGVAQYFTDCVLVEQGLPRMKSHLYEDELRCAKRLVAFTNRDLVARAYFLDHQPLLAELVAKLGGDVNSLKGLIDKKQLCDRLP
jgi:hypothetical protein